ncbi:glycosyltransferase family 4 protein [Mangrovibacterium diazotrophicum]|uniref:Glycosyltransferase involved in cell wall biosynthesis n=1 Tax=Mangrovibacterium diazotrophicum TaxID=1261403 RepID=A0A419W946_9BACT|nr:glycosyltransferase family 4 protein [Mangrovibacterium diazotrophicum]RKD91983.1 glycosyltransferase involved in cell wall biosynthesis [Mangrovibacterium diazotrophicum]
MRIAIVRTANGALNPNKYNIQEIGLGKGLVQQGHSVDLYSSFIGISQPTIHFQNSNSTLLLIPIKGIAFKQISYYRGLITQMLKGQYDLIQVHEDSQLMTAIILKAAKKAGIKTVLYQGMYENYTGLGVIYQKTLDFLFKRTTQRNADFVYAKTNAAKAYLENKTYRDVQIQPIGLDIKDKTDPFERLESLNEFKDRFDHLLLYVGVLEPRREVNLVLQSLKVLISKKNKNIGFVIVGKGPDKRTIEREIKELALERNVYWIESVPNEQIGSIYQACDLFLLPSHYEIYGMVVMEALYNGIPVVSSPTAGPIDILTEEFLGATAPLKIALWSETINHYLNSIFNSKESKQQRKDYILKRFSWNQLAQEYLRKLENNVYESSTDK